MHLASLLVALATPLLATSSNDPPSVQRWPIPSVHESLVQARRILYLQSIGTISTVFPSSPSSQHDSQEPLLPGRAGTLRGRRPSDVAAAPIGLMEYYASCPPKYSDPAIIGVTVSTSMKNAAAGSNVTLSLRYVLPATAPLPPPDPWAYLAANLPRFALVGYLERLSDEEVKKSNLTGCFFKTHPESRIWAPGSDVHDSWWARLRVEEIYFFGGFGDRSRIGWLPVEEWRNITLEEVEKYRLVGEEGYDKEQREWRGWLEEADWKSSSLEL
jgi:Pyridoxamine 5'-phosphate oxidase